MNPFSAITLLVIKINVCNPSPCGPYSQCKEVNNQAVCSCLPTYTGSPPNCRPECIVSSECPIDKACIQQKCENPCPGICGLNTKCNVRNHSPICICITGYTGDPFTKCVPIPCKLFHAVYPEQHVIIIFPSTPSSTYNRYCNKSMRSIPMWTQFSVSECRSCTILFMFT